MIFWSLNYSFSKTIDREDLLKEELFSVFLLLCERPLVAVFVSAASFPLIFWVTDSILIPFRIGSVSGFLVLLVALLVDLFAYALSDNVRVAIPSFDGNFFSDFIFADLVTIL